MRHAAAHLRARNYLAISSRSRRWPVGVVGASLISSIMAGKRQVNDLLLFSRFSHCAGTNRLLRCYARSVRSGSKAVEGPWECGRQAMQQSVDLAKAGEIEQALGILDSALAQARQ